MSQASTRVNAPMLSQHHVALHLAHRWFAFLEAPEGDLDTHLQMFHPQVLLSGSRGSTFSRTTTKASRPGSPQCPMR